MHRLRRVAGAAALFLSFAAVAPAATAAPGRSGPPPVIERVSVAAGGAQGDGGSETAEISADGRFAVFRSNATDLVPGDTNGVADIFVKDLRTGAVRRASVADDGTQAAATAFGGAVSANGRYVAFETYADGLAPGDAPEQDDVFVRDLVTGRTEVITPGTGTVGGVSRSPAISADGRFVAFLSTRNDLVPGDTNKWTDVFVRDRATGTTRRASVADDGTQANLYSSSPTISADGRKVGFTTAATNLDPAGAPADERAAGRPPARFFYVHDMRTGKNVRGAESVGGGLAPVQGPVHLSPDGRYALFTSYADDVVPGDTNAAGDSFARDLRTGTTRLLSYAYDGAQGRDYSVEPRFSADNRRVFFVSAADNLVPGDTNGVQDAFVRDLRTGEVRRLNVTAGGAQSAGDADGPVPDASGRTVVFTGFADDLVPGDTNASNDVFVRHLR